MRNSRNLIIESKVFAQESRPRSWFELAITMSLSCLSFALTFSPLPFFILCSVSILTGLLYVRLFVIYHDYQHHAILQNSLLATSIMTGIGIFLLAPQQVWKRTHDHHHHHNSKLTVNGIGSYPTVCKNTFLKMTSTQQKIYLLNRHPLTIFLGYFTLFIYWLNMKSFFQSPTKHIDSCLALCIHLSVGFYVYQMVGVSGFFISWFIPFFIAFGFGSYLFYCQHNFPTARFCENQDWQYDQAALQSTSFLTMNPFLQWMTGNIGYHHIHHINSRIPFYRLVETMKGMPELNNITSITLHPKIIYQCLQLKLWDSELNKMIRLDELHQS